MQRVKMELYDEIMQTSWAIRIIYSCVLREECTLMCVMDGHALFYKCTNISDKCHGLLPELLLLEPEIDKTRRMLPFFVRREHRGFFTAVHCCSEQSKIGTWVLGHSLVRSLVCLHHSLIRLLRPACFACAPRCTHSFARSLRSLPSSWEIEWLDGYFFWVFSILAHSTEARNCDYGGLVDIFMVHFHFSTL